MICLPTQTVVTDSRLPSDPPKPRLLDQAVLTPTVMKKLRAN